MTAEALPVQAEKQQEKTYSYWREVRRRLWRSRSARIGLTIIAIELFIAFIGPLLMAYDPIDFRDPNNRVRTPPCIQLRQDLPDERVAYGECAWEIRCVVVTG